jgi:predicted RNA-binding Zn ribbon-like protein
MHTTENTFASHGYGNVSSWIDLVNSEEWDGFGKLSDRLDEPAWRDAFLRQWNFHPGSREKTPLPALRTMRRLLRSIAQSLAAGHTPGAKEIAQLNATLSVPGRMQLIQHQNGCRTEFQPVRSPSDSGWGWILSRIAASAADAIVAGTAGRIRICANDDCRWAFRDPTKAGTKRWCSDRTCGNRARVRRLRAASR